MNLKCERIFEESKDNGKRFPSTLTEIELLVKKSDGSSPDELRTIKTALERLSDSSSWIVFHLVSDAVKKINSIIESSAASPEKSFESVRGIVAYLNDFYSTDKISGECLAKEENGQRDVKKFKFWSSLFI